MSEQNENIDFLDNEGVFYGLVIEWLKLNEDEQQKVKVFILNNYQNDLDPNCSNLYWTGSTRLLCIRFLEEIQQYDHIRPIKVKLLKLADELDIKFNELFYSENIDFNVGATTREEKEFFLMHLFLSLVREYFLVLPAPEISFKDEFRKMKPKSFMGYLLYPIELIFFPIWYFLTKKKCERENDPKRIASNDYRVNKVVRDIEQTISKIKAEKIEQKRQDEIEREKQEYLSSLISSINDL